MATPEALLQRATAAVRAGALVDASDAARALRDALESAHPARVADTSAAAVPWALSALSSASVSLDGSSGAFALRGAALSLLRALISGHGDAISAHVEPVLCAMLAVMKDDADTHAAEAMQAFADVAKTYRAQAEPLVGAFLDTVVDLAATFPAIVRARLVPRDSSDAAASPGTADASRRKRASRPSSPQQAEANAVPSARLSFRLLLDAPSVIVLLFQMHRKLVAEYVPRLVPAVISALAVDLAPWRNAQTAVTSVQSDTDAQIRAPSPSPLGEAALAQIKMLSFAAYVARGHPIALRDHRDALPVAVLRMLAQCPVEVGAARKELLLAVRHILSTELRAAFLPHAEALLDEHLVVGEGPLATAAFRAPALSLMADLVHHLRAELSPAVLERVLQHFTRTLNDASLPPTVQAMSAKLLLNTVDAVTSERFPAEARRPYIMRAFVAVALRFESLSLTVADLVHSRSSSGNATGTPSLPSNGIEFRSAANDAEECRPIATDSVGIDSTRDAVRDARFMLKTLSSAAKNLLLAMRTIASDPAAPLVTPDECETLVVPMFRHGVGCLDMLVLRNGSATGTGVSRTAPGTIAPIAADDKELMDQFGYVFTLLPPPMLQDVVAAGMDALVSRMASNTTLVGLPQYFLAIASASRPVAAVLARSLMARFDDIGSSDVPRAAVSLRLFKLLFLAVSVYPEENEAILQPHLSDIILGCFRSYPRAAAPLNYFMLLRSLFRAIGGGRFDALYKEILPLLPTILDELTHLAPAGAASGCASLPCDTLALPADDPAAAALRDLYVELCLTTPVRLSNLLPHLAYLMRPIVLALRASGDLVNQGLRTFELCLDNLTPDFLEPIMAPHFPDILRALWAMLRPPPANALHAHTAARLLGKLGAKARRYLGGGRAPSSSAPPSTGACVPLGVETTPAGPCAKPTFCGAGETGSALQVALGFETLSAASPGRTVAVRDAIHVPYDALVESAVSTAVESSGLARREALSFVLGAVARIVATVPCAGESRDVACVYAACDATLARVEASEANDSRVANSEGAHEDDAALVREAASRVRGANFRSVLVETLPASNDGDVVSLDAFWARRSMLSRLVDSLWRVHARLSLPISASSNGSSVSLSPRERSLSLVGPSEMPLDAQDAILDASAKERVADTLHAIYHAAVLVDAPMPGAVQPPATVIDAEALLETLVDAATAPGDVTASFAWKVICDVHVLQQRVGGPALPPPAPQGQTARAFHTVAERAIGACFEQTAARRVAAARLVGRLCDLELGVSFLWHYALRFMRGVLFVLKSLPAGVAARLSAELTAVVFKVLRLADDALSLVIARAREATALGLLPAVPVSNASATGSPQQDTSPAGIATARKQQFFEQVVGALVAELSNPNSVVRETVKGCFRLLSDTQGCEVTDLLSPFRMRVYGPIFSKPLRALPLHVQTGYIDAITYCLALRPPLLETSDELLRLVGEALAVIEADDAALGVRPSASLASTAHVLSLRVVCVRLLSTCLTGPDFSQPRLHALRNQIVGVFFKTLYSPMPELVEVARAALEHVMAQPHKLPTELLQNGLRPVLQSLGDPRSLTLAAVDGLRRILQLFSHFFKAEIGRKLLEHLHSWASDRLSGVSPPAATPGSASQSMPLQSSMAQTDAVPDLRVLTAIMELFCMLPSCGALFTADLLVVAISLETVLRRRASSPFRAVLLRFLEQYPAEAVAALVDRLNVLSSTPVEAAAVPYGTPAGVAQRQHSAAAIIALFSAVVCTGSAPTSRPTPSSPALQPASADDDAQPQLPPAAQGNMAPRLLSELSKAFDAMAKAIFAPGMRQETRTAILALVRTFYARSGPLPAGVVENHGAMLGRIWAALEATPVSPNSPLPLAGTAADVLYARALCDATMAFVQANPGEVEPALWLQRTASYDAPRRPSVVDVPSLLPAFYRAWITGAFGVPLSGVSVPEAIVRRWLSGTQSRESADAALLMRNMYAPALLALASNSSASVDAVGGLDSNIWSRSHPRASTDASIMEELQVTALAARQCTRGSPLFASLDAARPRALAFVLRAAQSPDCAVRYAAFQTLLELTADRTGSIDSCRTVSDIAGALLRCPATDVRPIVRQAFETVLPALSAAYIGDASEVASAAVAVLGRSLGRDVVMVSLVAALWAAVVAHADDIAPLRRSLAAPLAQSLVRCGLVALASPDTRSLPFDIARVLLRWLSDESLLVPVAHSSVVAHMTDDGESLMRTPQSRAKTRKTREGASASDAANAAVTSPPVSVAPTVDIAHVRETVCTALVRMLAALGDYSSSEGAALFAAGMALVDSVALPSAVDGVRLASLERLLAAADPSPSSSAVSGVASTSGGAPAANNAQAATGQSDEVAASHACGLALLARLVRVRSAPALQADAQALMRWIRRAFERASSPRVASALGTLLDALLVAAPPGATPATDALWGAAAQCVLDGLSSPTVPPSGDASPALAGAMCALAAADGTLLSRVLQPDAAFPSFGRAIQRATREYLLLGATPVGDAVATSIVLPALDVGARHVAHSEFCRALFLQAVSALWENTMNHAIMRRILVLLGDWARLPEDAMPTVRERVDVLLLPSRMLEQAALSAVNGLSTGSSQPSQNPSHASVLEAYYDVVHAVYVAPSFVRTELRARMEGAFLAALSSEALSGTPLRDRRFAQMLHAAVPRSLPGRLRHVFETQRWELLGSAYWLPLAVDLILGAAVPLDSVTVNGDLRSGIDLADDGSLRSQTYGHMRLLASGMLHDVRSALSAAMHRDAEAAHAFTVAFLPRLWCSLGLDARAAQGARLARLFASDAHLCVARMRPNAIATLVAALAEGSLTDRTGASGVAPTVPAPLVAYAMRTYGAWHSGATYLERVLESAGGLPLPTSGSKTTPAPHTAPGAWAELVATLGAMLREMGESDAAHGALRRGFVLPESNAALSFAQLDLWAPAQRLLETAMARVRAGAAPYSEPELLCWEERWTHAAKRLQQWDLLNDVSRADADADLGLECLWRLGDWASAETQTSAASLLRAAPEPTSRLKFLEAFLVLSGGSLSTTSTVTPLSERVSANQVAAEDSLQLALAEWQALPQTAHGRPGPAHARVLHSLQMLAELGEANALYGPLLASGGGPGAAAALGRPQFLADLKSMLSAWRERLPNAWDDMDCWSDILAWRQHVFGAMNTAFAPLAEAAGGGSASTPGAPGAPPQQHPFAFRGYHEMAWLINRFAHAARKNALPDVCLSFLNRIYTLPNIEIQDAFVKLREQAKSHMASPAELPAALEVVNMANLSYFVPSQKADFFALRAAILARLGAADEANRVFAQAMQIDLTLGRGWAAWGRFNDQRFAQTQDLNTALNAINCYLQAASLFKAHKSRRFLARILWLFTFEDAAGSLSRSFEAYNNELPTWFWVSFVPQLLPALARREQRQVRFVLFRIAKNYPQALYLPLRAFHEEVRLQLGTRQRPSDAAAASVDNMCATGTSTAGAAPIAASAAPPNSAASAQTSTAAHAQPNATAQSNSQGAPGQLAPRRTTLEAVEDLLSLLKTGYPLLSLTMENAMEHIVHRLRSTADEDFYRVLTSLIGEAFQHMMLRISGHGTTQTSHGVLDASLRRVFTMICNAPQLSQAYRAAFERDFLTPRPHAPGPDGSPGDADADVEDVLRRLFVWRARLEPSLERRHPRALVLDGHSRFLAEFEYHRYDELDVPGQYLLMRDNNQDFVKVERFEPAVAVVRRHGTSYRRLLVRGSDGRQYAFAVQNPAGRQTRREERVLQLLRFLDVAMRRGLDCRRRDLYLSVPAVVSISAHVRLLADDPSATTFEDVLEAHCVARREAAGRGRPRTGGLESEQIFLHFRAQVHALHTAALEAAASGPEVPAAGNTASKPSVEMLSVRTDVFGDVCAHMVPADVLSRHMARLATNAADRWTMRRDFTRQLATTLFTNYTLNIAHRFLHRLAFSRATMAVLQSEVIPMVTTLGQISLIEAVPFRYTPNLQDYVTPAGTEGTLLSAVVAVARCLARADSDLSEYLTVFVRDELLLWCLNSVASQQQGANQHVGEIVENPLERLEAAGIDTHNFFGRVQQNCELVLKRAQTLACIKEEEQHASERPAVLFQTLLDLLSAASNPQKLAQMDPHWHPWF